MGRLLIYQATAHQLIEIRENATNNLDPNTLTIHEASNFGLQDPQGMTFDPAHDYLYFLDATGPRLVRIKLQPDGSFTNTLIDAVNLPWAGNIHPRGIAFDPTSGNLHVVSPGEQKLYEFNIAGTVVAVRDLSEFNLSNPQGIVFAPSGDQTDDPSQVSLYLADNGFSLNSRNDISSSNNSTTARTPGKIVELSLVQPLAEITADFTSALVRTTNMAAFSPPSPDPSGLTYLSSSNTLLMSDGEVEETVNGITHFMGANLWELTLNGVVVRTANISTVPPTFVPMTNEPTGVTWNPANGHYYFSDDNGGGVFDLSPGIDGLVGTADDSWTRFSTLAFGDGDAEGITYDTWHDQLYVVDGVNREVYQYSLSGSLLSQFDVEAYGVTDPEGVEFNPVDGTLFVLSSASNRIIIETTISGSLLQTINVSASSSKAPAGLAYAPASDGSGSRHFYIVDRGIDNNNDPNIIDGKMYELTAPVPSTPANTPPIVNAGSDQSITIDTTAILNGSAVDDGLPNPPGVMTTLWSVVSGPGNVTFDNPNALATTASFSSTGTYVLRLTASDSESGSYDEISIIVTGSSGSTILEVRVATGSDDAEESATGSVDLVSSDLELVAETTIQTVGMRFNGITIPKNAQINNAYIQFQVDEVGSTATSLAIWGEAKDNPGTFVVANQNISSRLRTSALVGWSPPPWTILDQAGVDQRTSNISPIIQEIINRPGWSEGNSVVIMIGGTGKRTAEAYNGVKTAAPMLHVEWSTTPQNQPPSVMISTPRNNTTFTEGYVITFSGVANDLEEGDKTSGLVWTSSLDGLIGTGGNFSRSDLTVGMHTITAMATDGSGLTGSTSRTITVFANAPVLVGAGDIAICNSNGTIATSQLLDNIAGSVFTAGDNAQLEGAESEFINCYDPTWGRHKARTYPVPGNHDYNTPGASAYYAYFGTAAGEPGKGYYSYDLGSWHIIALNSVIDVNAGSIEEQWLRTDLAAHPNTCTLAYWHYPRFSSGTTHGSNDHMGALWQALYDYGADVVINGHEHIYERFAAQNPQGVAEPARGIREFIVGTGGAYTDYPIGTPIANSEVINNNTYGVIKLTLHATSYDWEFIP
ncbi:MAG: metallophosphoesterase, partial [Anaerolineales bacterium]